MKKTLLFFIFFSLFFCCDTYADDSLLDNGIFEGLPGPPGISEKAIKFEPDPNDFDGDGILNVDEEKYGTDPNDPDTDNDGILDLTEITNGTDPNSKNTTGYLEVIDLEKNTKDTKSTEDIIDINGQSPLPPGAENDLPPFPWDNVTYRPKVIDDKELENIDEYTDIIPPILDNEEDLSLSRNKENNSISKDNLNDLADEENNQTAMLNRTTSGPDLTPIFMLLLLGDWDGDGIDDDWEMRHFGTLAYGADDDPDQDNLSNLGEYNNHTNPNNPDTDGDGLTDGFEVLNGLNPTNSDSDSDTMADGWEVAYGLNPLVDDAYGDLDNDGFPNYFEYVSQTDPTNPNSHPSGIIYNFNYDNNGNLSTMQRRE